MKFLKKRIFVIAAVGFAAAIMLIMTIMSAVNMADRTDTVLSLEAGQVPTVIETIEDGTVIGTRGGSVIRKSADNEVVWEYDLPSGGALQDIAVDKNEILCITAETKEIFSLDLETGALLGADSTSYEPVGIAADDGHLVVNTHLRLKNQLVVYTRGENGVDFSSAQKSDSSFSQFTNIEMTENGLFGFCADSNAYLFDPDNIAASPEVLFTVTTEELIFMTSQGDTYSAVTKDGKFVEFDAEGNLLKKVGVDGSFDKVASSDGHIVAVTTANKIVYFSEGKVRTVSAGVSVSRLMIDSKSVFLIDSGDNINVYDFTRIAANHTWKILLPVFAVLTGIALIATAVLLLLALPATRQKVRSFFRRVGKALWTYKKTYLFLLIPFALIGIFGFFPVVWGFVLAFTKYIPGVKMEFVGFKNFITAFHTPNFLGSTGNMILVLGVDLGTGLIPCFILAEMMFMFRMKKMGYAARVLTVLPGILPGVALVYIWTSGIYGANGLINMVLQGLGFEQFNFNWLGNEQTARTALMFYGFPFLGSYIMLFSALRGIPDSLMEAAKLDGCNKFKRLFLIDLPLLTPQMKYIFVTTFIASLQNFGRSFLTTGGEFGTMIPSLEIYYQINKYSDYGVAAAMSLLLFVVIFIATMINQKIKTESVY